MLLPECAAEVSEAFLVPLSIRCPSARWVTREPSARRSLWAKRLRPLCHDGPCGAAAYPAMGMVPTSGQGHVGRGPLPAGPRSAYGLAPPQVVRPRGGRPRLARGVHYLEVDQERGPCGRARSPRPPPRPGGDERAAGPARGSPSERSRAQRMTNRTMTIGGPRRTREVQRRVGGKGCRGDAPALRAAHESDFYTDHR